MDFKEKVRLAMILSLAVLQFKRTEGSQLNSPGFQPWENVSQWLRPEGTREGGSFARILRPYRTRSFIFAVYPGLKPWAIMRWAFSPIKVCFQSVMRKHWAFNPITVCSRSMTGMRWAAPFEACKSIVRKCWTSLNVAGDSIVRDQRLVHPFSIWYKNSSGVRCGKRTEGSQLNSPGFQPWDNMSQQLRPEGTREGGNGAKILRPYRTRSFIFAVYPGLKPWAILRWAFSPIKVCLGYIAGMRWAAPIEACMSFVRKRWTSLNVAGDSIMNWPLSFSPYLITSTPLNIQTKDQG